MTAALLTAMALCPAAMVCAGDAKPAATAASDRVLDTKSSRALGLAPGWQTRLPKAESTPLAGLHAGRAQDDRGEDLYAWDNTGVVIKVDPKTGELRWQSAGVFSKDSSGLLDVQTTTVRGQSVAVGLGDVSCVVLDERTGAEQGLSPYTRIPITRSVRVGKDFVFGSRAGQVVWLGFREERIASQVEPRGGDPVTKGERVAVVHVVPYELQAFQLGGAIRTAPISTGKSIIACSDSGQIACFSNETRSPVWKQKLPGGIVASPSADATQVMIACRDQYLRSVDIETGRTNWRWFTESPLERDPLLAGDVVVIQVPELGLVALDASDSKSLNRAPLWTTKVGGDAITRLADGLLVWDAASGTLSLVDAKSGKVRDSRELGMDVKSVQATAAINGDVLILMKDGRLQRCPPLNAFVMPTKAATPAPGEAAEAPPTDAANAEAAAPGSQPTDGGA